MEFDFVFQADVEDVFYFLLELGKRAVISPIHYRNLTLRYYQKILRQIGLGEEGFVLYSLRHTCATLLLIAGENPKVVSERLGHSSVRITLDIYSRHLPDLQQNASDKLETMLYRTVTRR